MHLKRRSADRNGISALLPIMPRAILALHGMRGAVQVVPDPPIITSISITAPNLNLLLTPPVYQGFSRELLHRAVMIVVVAPISASISLPLLPCLSFPLQSCSITRVLPPLGMEARRSWSQLQASQSAIK